MNVVELLQQQFSQHILSVSYPFDLPTITVSKDKAVEILQYLKTEEQVLKFHFLTDLCGVHQPEHKAQEMMVVYHLQSMTTNQRLRIKIAFEKSFQPPTATTVYASANWMERETFDFYGIKFKDHPDLRRILNVDEMNYFPLLKQYPLEDQTRSDKNDTYFGR